MESGLRSDRGLGVLGMMIGPVRASSRREDGAATAFSSAGLRETGHIERVADEPIGAARI